MRRLAVVLAPLVAAAALPAPAGAHARLVGSDPADGTVLARAPSVVRVTFDDAVRPGSRIAAIRNGGGSVLAGRARMSSGSRVLEIPLRAALPLGDYTVRWDVRSDDGHELAGVLAFGVGLGRAAPVASLSAGGGVEARDLAWRWLFFAGLLAAVGSVACRLLVWPGARIVAVTSREELRTSSAILCAGLLLALAGAATAGHGFETRAGVAYEFASAAAAAGAVLAALAFVTANPVAWFAPAVLAVALLPVPTIAGHALDRDQSALAPVADLVHVAAAAVWLGVLVSLALVVPRAVRGLEPDERQRLYAGVAPRASGIVVGSLALLSVAGLARALEELSAVDELWTTGYGRTILVKTGLLAALLAAGWQNRFRLLPALARGLGRASTYARLRRNVLVELGGFVLLVSAVALLTDLAPGSRAGSPAAAPAPPAEAPPPPTDALVLAAQARELAVGLALKPAGAGRVDLTATVLGQDGYGARGLDVAFGLDGPADTTGVTCGAGCYRATVEADSPTRATVRVGAETVDLPLGERWPPPRAGALVGRAARTFRSLRTLSSLETLESRPGTRIVSHFRFVAPDRLSYRIERGPEGIVIGTRRWDRDSASGTWKASPQQRLTQPTTPWRAVRDARLLGTETVRGRRVQVVSFLDPTTPAWFTIRVDAASGRTLDVGMTAAAHFMTERYSDFDAPLRIRPPAGAT